MTNVALLLAVLVASWLVFQYVQRNRRRLVPERGTSVGADLGALSDLPRVRVQSVTIHGPDQVRVVLTPESGTDLDFLVSMTEDDFGFGLLNEWQQSGRPVAIVCPAGTRLVRLRSIDDLQPLTLRRVDSPS